jgi:hypothetical protein
MVYLIFTILLYVLGTIPTYCFYDEVTSQSTFNKIWFAAFWPATSLIIPVVKLIQFFGKKKNK